MALERLFTPKAELARREKIICTLSSIDELLPQEDGVSAEKYTSYSLAPRIRLAAYNGDSTAQRVLVEYPAIKDADDVFVNFDDFSKKESSFGITAAKEGLHFCYDSQKFKVTNKGAYGFRKIEKPEELFENLLGFVEADLLEGRKAWAEILRQRKAEYISGFKTQGLHDLEKEIETLVDWTIERNEELVLFGDIIVNDGQRNIADVYSTFNLKDERARQNLTLNYAECKGIVPKFYDDEKDRQTFEIDYPDITLRMRRIPLLETGEVLDLVEGGFADFMKGNGGFGYKIKGVGPVTLIGLDPVLEDNVPVFGEAPDKN